MQIEDWIVHDIPEHIIIQASDWIIQLDKLEHDEKSLLLGASDEQLQEQFYQWLNNDPLHQMAFLQLSEMWAKSSMLKHMEHLIERSEVLSFPSLYGPSSTYAEQTIRVSESNQLVSAPAWMYAAAIGLILAGSLAPMLL